VAVPIGVVAARPDEEDVEHGRPLVLRPDSAPRDGVAPGRTAEMGLEDIPLFAALPEDARTRLAAAGVPGTVEAGAWLFREGDPPGSAYVLRSGRLEVVLNGQVVRELAPGAILGELALLTGEPRSAGIRARRDSSLLELPRKAFHALLDGDPAVGRTVLTQVAGQLRSAQVAAPLAPATQPHVVAVVGLLDGSGAADVAAAVVDRLGRYVSVVAPAYVGAEGLARAEVEHDRVVLVADGSDPVDRPGWREFCLRQADLVVLVARTDQAPVPPGEHPLAASPELVLVGDAPSPSVRAGWVAASDAWQLTIVEGDMAAGVRALADRIAGRSLGLVLAGGGARAFAHVGVLRELEDSGFRVDRVAGCSIGSIIAAVHATGVDGATLEEACYAEFVRRNPFGDWTLPRHSLARGQRSRAGLQRVLGADTVMEGLPRQLHVVSTDLVSRTRQVHRRGSAVEATVASVRLPVLFPPVPTDDGRLLTDGGVLDNLPVDLLTERNEGPVLAVNISMGGSGGRSRRPGRPRIPALGETLLRTMMIGSGGAVEAAHRHGAVVLTPDAQGVGLLEFHQFDRMVRSGREAARALLTDGTLDLGVAGALPGDLAPEDLTREDPDPSLPGSAVPA
jgi:NTE family protein